MSCGDFPAAVVLPLFKQKQLWERNQSVGQTLLEGNQGMGTWDCSLANALLGG